MTTTQTMEIPRGRRQTEDGEMGYAHVDGEDLQDVINLLLYYLNTLVVPNENAEDDEAANYRLMAATMRICERFADTAADHLEKGGADGDPCRAYLKRLDAEDARLQHRRAVSRPIITPAPTTHDD